MFSWRKVIMLTVPFFAATSGATALGQTIYRSVDDQGQVTFSDRPPSTAVEIAPVEVLPGPDAARVQAARERQEKVKAAADELAGDRARREQRLADQGRGAQIQAPSEPLVVEERSSSYPYHNRPNQNKPGQGRPGGTPGRPPAIKPRPTPYGGPTGR